MKKIIVHKPVIKLIGLTARTNNAQEMNPALAKIRPTIQKYFEGSFHNKILHRKNPGVMLCFYTEYENDHTGDYTYFIGEEVESFENVPGDLTCITIPSQTYVKFTTQGGPMPTICIEAWQKIWQMTPEELGGRRNFMADFEVYDERAVDPHNTILDVYIGIQP